MPTILTPEQLRARFTGARKSIAWYDSVVLYHKLRVHADGELPIHLIKNARPNESEEVRNYRENIYEAETQNPIQRVIGVLEKIRRSPDWMIRFKDDIPAIITKEETLESYVSEHYPIYQSLENWLFEEALKNIALDANAVCIVMPENLLVNGNEYVRPIAKLFNSPNIVDFVSDDYVIVRSDEYSSLLPPDQQQARAQAIALSYANSYIDPLAYGNTGNGSLNIRMQLPYTIVAQVYYVVNMFSYEKWEETNDGKYEMTAQYFHNMNALPAFQLPGKFHKRMGDSVIKKTPLNPMVPHLNKAARESNDLDAGVIMHLYLEKWRINNIPCPECTGTGKVLILGKPDTCSKCKGNGMANGKSPFNEVVISPAKIGEQNIPTPPIGYVQKDTKILELQNERIKEHIQKSLDSINMDHLGETPLAQSGIAKSYDRDEVNNLIYAFAESLCLVANTVVFWINELRYKDLVGDEQKRKAMLPVIPVPEKFDVINTTFLLAEYQAAKTAGLNSTILDELQIELAQKKFYANPIVGEKVKTIMQLDPFPSKTLEEKSLLEAQQLATKEDVILSNYISDFVSQAIEDDPKFLEKTKVQKRDILIKYAKAKVDLLNQAKQMAQDVFQQSPQGQQAADQMKQFNQDTRLMTSVQNAKV